MRLSVFNSIIVVVVVCVFLIGLSFYKSFGQNAVGVGRLALYRLVLPSAERRLCAAKRRLVARFNVSAAAAEDEACDIEHAEFMKSGGTGYWAETIQTTASEVVSRAHAELHFTKRIVLLGTTHPDETAFIGEDLLEITRDPMLQCLREVEAQNQESGVKRAWLLQGYSLANVMIAETQSSLLLIDTGDTPTALLTMILNFSNAACVPMKPVEVVLVSHYHTDHIGGIGGVAAYNLRIGHSHVKPKVISHSDTARAITQYFLVHPQANLRRAMKQFGISQFIARPTLKSAGGPALTNQTVPGVISAGIGLSLDAVGHESSSGADRKDLVQYPTHTWSGGEKAFSFRDLKIEMLKSPGETVDQVSFYIPALRVFYISDNFYFAFPNIYPLRGGVFRNPAAWWQSLDHFLKHYAPRTDVLGMGHTSPVIGKELIVLLVERYRDSIQFVNDQTIRLMNHLDDADMIARNVARLFWSNFPKINTMPYSKSMLKSMPVLLMDPVMPFYGQLHWAAKAVVFRERGWFGGQAEEVNSHRVTPATRHRKLRDLINDPNANILKAIHKALADYDCQWALELTTIAMAPRTHFGRPTAPTFRVCLEPDVATELDDPGLKTLFDEWRDSFCSNRTTFDLWLDDPGELDLTAQSSGEDEEDDLLCRAFTDEMTPTLRCARKQALWCLARRELPSSGRNWYVVDSLDDMKKIQDESASIETATRFRTTFLSNAPDLISVLHSFPLRLEPGVISYQNIPTVIRIHFVQDETREVEDFASFDKLVFSENRTVDIISRNSILIIEDHDLITRDSQDPNFIEVWLRWSAFRKVLLKSYPAGPVRLWMQGGFWFENTRPRTQRFKDFCKIVELLLAIEHE